MYCDCNCKTFKFLKYFLQESLVLAPIIILIILLFTLKIVLHEEFTLKLFHHSLCSENVHSILHLLYRGCNDFRHNHLYDFSMSVCYQFLFQDILYWRWKILYYHNFQVNKRTIHRRKLHELFLLSLLDQSYIYIYMYL